MDPPSPAPSSRRWVTAAAPVAFYTLFSLYLCSEFLSHPTSRLPFQFGDGMLSFWNYWWARWATLDLHTWPLATTYLSSPHEVSLLFQAHDLLHGLLSIPVQLAVAGLPGLVLAVNLATFACYLGSALAAYAWFRLLVGSRPAAFFAGIGYAFSAYHATWAPMPVVAALYWLPLFAFLVLRAVRRPGRRTALLPGLCFGLCTFQSLYYTLFLAVLAPVLAVFVLLSEGASAAVRRRLLAIAAGLVLFAAPMAGLVMRDLWRSHYATVGQKSVDAPKDIDDDCRMSIDLAGIVIPTPGQGLWSPPPQWNEYLLRKTCKRPLFGVNGIGGELTYVGAMPLLLALLAWACGRRRVVAVWTVGTVLFIGLALGPFLHLNGEIYRQAWLPLPYRLVVAVPAIGKMYHAPAYFWVLALFGIWTLSAMTLAWLFERSDRLSWIALTSVSGWMIVDYARPPLPAWPAPAWEVYERIAADPTPVTVLEVPVDYFLLLEVYSAGVSVHHRPLARGFISRADTTILRRDTMIQNAYRSIGALQELVDELGPVYLVIHRDTLRGPVQTAFPAMVERQFPKAKVFSSVDVDAYRLDPRRSPSAALPRPGVLP